MKHKIQCDRRDVRIKARRQNIRPRCPRCPSGATVNSVPRNASPVDFGIGCEDCVGNGQAVRRTCSAREKPRKTPGNNADDASIRFSLRQPPRLYRLRFPRRCMRLFRAFRGYFIGSGPVWLRSFFRREATVRAAVAPRWRHERCAMKDIGQVRMTTTEYEGAGTAPRTRVSASLAQGLPVSWAPVQGGAR